MAREKNSLHAGMRLTTLKSADADSYHMATLYLRKALAEAGNGR